MTNQYRASIDWERSRVRASVPIAPSFRKVLSSEKQLDAPLLP